MAFHLWPRSSADSAPPLPPAPARLLLREIPPVEIRYPLSRAMNRFRQHQVSGLPVTHAGELVGWVTETQVADALTADPANAETTPIQAVMSPVPAVVSPDARDELLLAPFHATGSGLLPVVTDSGQYLGCVTRLDALAARDGWFPPPRIGGMATPLGVYLTTGTVSGGAGHWALILTGMLFTVMMWLTQTGLRFVTSLLANVRYSAFLQDLARVLDQQLVPAPPLYALSLFLLALLLQFGCFLLLLRVAPRLTGYHAAEHQTVNAIEAGEPLTPENVARMPRVHPRCGTNLWSIILLTQCGVGAMSMLLSIETFRRDVSLPVILATFGTLLVTLVWRRVGSWFQQHLTTRPASPAEIASGIAAGQELLMRHLDAAAQPPRRGMRLWRTGFIQVLIGVTLMSALFWLLDVLR